MCSRLQLFIGLIVISASANFTFMMESNSIGKVLIVAGAVLVVIGIILLLANRIPFIGRLPGDIFFRKGNFTFYFPVVTSIVLSIVLTLIFYLISKFRQ